MTAPPERSGEPSVVGCGLRVRRSAHTRRARAADVVPRIDAAASHGSRIPLALRGLMDEERAPRDSGAQRDHGGGPEADAVRAGLERLAAW